MIQFTEKELKQIISMAGDLPRIMEVLMSGIPGLSIAGAKLDMLQIQLKGEAMLMELAKGTPPPQLEMAMPVPKQSSKHVDGCPQLKDPAHTCWCSDLSTSVGDLKKRNIKQ